MLTPLQLLFFRKFMGVLQVILPYSNYCKAVTTSILATQMHQHSTDQLVCNNSGLSPKHAICHIRDSIVGVNRFKQSPIRSYCSQSKLLAQSLVLIDLNKRQLEANILNQNYQIQTNSNQELKHSRYKTHPKYAAPFSLLSRKGVLVGGIR